MWFQHCSHVPWKSLDQAFRQQNILIVCQHKERTVWHPDWRGKDLPFCPLGQAWNRERFMPCQSFVRKGLGCALLCQAIGHPCLEECFLYICKLIPPHFIDCLSEYCLFWFHRTRNGDQARWYLFIGPDGVWRNTVEVSLRIIQSSSSSAFSVWPEISVRCIRQDLQKVIISGNF